LNKTLAITAVASLGLLGTASPALARPAQTSATWDAGCTAVVVDSTKDISNIVYRIDGADTKIELHGSFHAYELPGTATDVWVKSGNNLSGDGPGYGEHHARPAACDTSGGPRL
jgi:hypothetical protein